MEGNAFHSFIDSLMEKKTITDDDLYELKTKILPEGIKSRAQADALIALDRVVHTGETWPHIFTTMVVNFVLWGERRKGHIDRETAHWLISSLEVGELTYSGSRIVREAVLGAKIVDPVFVDFMLQRVRRYARNRYDNQNAA